MYYLTSPQQIMDNVVALSKPYLNHRQQNDLNALRSAYHQYLKTIQPDCGTFDKREIFYSDAATENAFLGFFGSEDRISLQADEFDFEYQRNVLYPDPEVRKNVLIEALDTIQEYEPIWADLFKFVMHAVFCTVTHRVGGTAVNPSYIGVMCAYYSMNAEKKAVSELLIHEFTHNALFLDEHRYGHYTDYDFLNTNKDTFIQSFYKGNSVLIPFDRAFHRLIVFIEILQARNLYIGHQPLVSQHAETPYLLKICALYLEQMLTNPSLKQLLTLRAKELLDQCQKFLSNFRICNAVIKNE